MLNVMLIDDEPMVLEGMLRAIPWGDLECKIIGTATNGVEGLERALKWTPDIIFTDIRMPLMDGIEMSKHIKEKVPDCEIVILSGHEEFAYAQSAMTLGVRNYLLKPLDKDEFIEIVQSLAQHIRSRNAWLNEYVELKQELQSHLPLVKNYMLQNLLYNSHSSENLNLKSSLLNISLSMKPFYLVLLDQDNQESGIEQEPDYELITALGIRKRIYTYFNDWKPAWEWIEQRGRCVVILEIEEHHQTRDLEDQIEIRCNHIISEIKETMRLSASAGISSMKSSYNLLPTALRECEMALEQRFFQGKEQVIFFHHVNRMPTVAALIPAGKLEQIGMYLRLVQKAPAIHLLEQLFQAIAKNSVSMDYLYSISMQVLLMLQNALVENRIKMSKLGAFEESFSLQRLQRNKTVEDLLEFMKQKMESVFNELEQTTREWQNSAIATAIHYMKANYERELTLQEVADHVYLSKNYLSALLKKESSKNFVDILTEFRMERAKELLRDPKIKTLEVAERVGYKNYAHFSQLFKNEYGLTPKDYKQLYAEYN